MKRHSFQEFLAFRSLWCVAICAWGSGHGVIGSPSDATSTFSPIVNAGINFRQFRASTPRLLGSRLLGSRPLMGPGLAAPECKIVGVGGLPAYMRLGFDDLVGNPLTLAISDSVFL